jgi:hypothetical protein
MTQPHDNITYLTSLVQIFSNTDGLTMCALIRSRELCTSVKCIKCPFNYNEDFKNHTQFLTNLIPVAAATGLIIGETNVSENSK